MVNGRKERKPMENLNEFEVMESKNQYYTLLDSNNRITMATSIQQEDKQFLFDYPTGFDFGAIHDYKIVDGKLIHEPVIYSEPEPQPTLEDRIAKLETDKILTEQSITDMDLQNIETEQAITELDLRLTTLGV